MYADRHASPHRLNPVSIALAIAINGAVMGALVFSAPIVEKIAANGPFILYPVKEPPPPEPRADTATRPKQEEFTDYAEYLRADARWEAEKVARDIIARERQSYTRSQQDRAKQAV